MLFTGLALGVVLGYVMQRGRFCVTGMIRDIFTQGQYRGLIALFIVIAVHAIGLAGLATAGIITPRVNDFAPLAVIVGGILFGMGIILAGGCASGTWYRSGEGLVGSWIALIFYGLSAAAMNAGALTWLDSSLANITVSATTIHHTLGISIWWLAIPFAFGTALAAAHFLRQESLHQKPAALKPKKTGLAHILAEKPWHSYSTAVVIGLLGVLAWPLSAASGRNSGLGITTPSSDTMRFITTGDTARVNWGTLLVLGLLAGAFLAARASGEFRVRVPDATQAVRSVVGGTLMGVGAVWAGGCTVGNGMVQTSLFSYQGWVALVCIAVGIWLGAQLWLKPTHQVSAVATTSAMSLRMSADTADSVCASTHADGVAFAASLVSGGSAVGALNKPGTRSSAQPIVQNTPGKEGLRSLGSGRYALDTLGAVCPFPLIDAKAAMAMLDVGEELVIEFDCTQGTDSIPRWAATDGHEVTNFEATGEAGWTISIRKG